MQVALWQLSQLGHILLTPCSSVANTADCSGIIDLAFVLHSAGTVYPERWRYITQFVVDAIKRLDVGTNRTRVAVITWSDTAEVAFTLDQFTSRQDVTQVSISVLSVAVCLWNRLGTLPASLPCRIP